MKYLIVAVFVAAFLLGLLSGFDSSVRCDSCGGRFHIEDMTIHGQYAFCPECEEVF